MNKKMEIDTIGQVHNMLYLPSVTVEVIDSLINKFPEITEYSLRKFISGLIEKDVENNKEKLIKSLKEANLEKGIHTISIEGEDGSVIHHKIDIKGKDDYVVIESELDCS